MKNQTTWAEEISNVAEAAHKASPHMNEWIQHLVETALKPHVPRKGGEKIQAHRALCALANLPVTVSLFGFAAEFMPELSEGHWEWFTTSKGFESQRFIKNKA